jgi:hypothetical protein
MFQDFIGFSQNVLKKSMIESHKILQFFISLMNLFIYK